MSIEDIDIVYDHSYKLLQQYLGSYVTNLNALCCFIWVDLLVIIIKFNICKVSWLMMHNSYIPNCNKALLSLYIYI